MKTAWQWAAILTTASGAALCPAFSASAEPPPISSLAKAAGLIDVRSVIPDAVVDLRYATPDNFVGQTRYPADARCLVHQDLARGLAAAADRLREKGEVLVFWDCCRPHHVQVRMFHEVPNPKWVARPSQFARSHESGRSVDVTLADGLNGERIDMGTDFDDFTPRSMAYATDGITAVQQANRARLREAMEAGGLTLYPGDSTLELRRKPAGDGCGGKSTTATVTVISRPLQARWTCQFQS